MTKRQSTEDIKMTQMQGLSDKDIKGAIITMLRDQFETCMKEKKIESLSKEDRRYRENQIEILEMKNNNRTTEITHWIGSTVE